MSDDLLAYLFAAVIVIGALNVGAEAVNNTQRIIEGTHRDAICVRFGITFACVQPSHEPLVRERV